MYTYVSLHTILGEVWHPTHHSRILSPALETEWRDPAHCWMSVQRKVAFSFTNMLYLFIKECMIMEKSTRLSQDHHLTPGTHISGQVIQQFLAGGRCLAGILHALVLAPWLPHLSCPPGFRIGLVTEWHSAPACWSPPASCWSASGTPGTGAEMALTGWGCWPGATDLPQLHYSAGKIH